MVDVDTGTSSQNSTHLTVGCSCPSWSFSRRCAPLQGASLFVFLANRTAENFRAKVMRNIQRGRGVLLPPRMMAAQRRKQAFRANSEYSEGKNVFFFSGKHIPVTLVTKEPFLIQIQGSLPISSYQVYSIWNIVMGSLGHCQ